MDWGPGIKGSAWEGKGRGGCWGIQGKIAKIKGHLRDSIKI